MNGKNQEFILHSKKIKKADSDMLGELGVKYAELFSSPNTFFVTTVAFDTFLLATQIAEDIQELLSKVRLNSYDENVKIANAISELIMSQDIPQIISRPLEQTYRNLIKGNASPLIKVKPSTIVPLKNQSDSYKRISHTYVSGFETLLNTIKLAWTTLFIAEELENRVRTAYKGDLTCAVIVQEVLHPEVSGRITLSKKLAEVSACFGIDEALENVEESSDVYILDYADSKIKSKVVHNQNKMFIRNINLTDTEKFYLPVNVSKDQRSVQKLSDDLLITISEDLEDLYELVEKDFAVGYAVEAGQIFYTDIIYSEQVEEIKITKGKKLGDGFGSGSRETTGSNSGSNSKPANNSTNYSSSNLNTFGNSESDVDLDAIASEVFEDVKSKEAEREIENKDLKPESFNLKEEKNKLRTKINILMQSSKPSELILGREFDGVVINGTSILKKFENLPDDVLGSAKKLRELSEKYSQEILTFGKSFKNNRLFYYFSNLYSEKTDNDGDLRLLEDQKIFYTELLGLQLAENEYGVVVEDFILSGIRSIENFEALLKQFRSVHFPKKNKRRFFLEVSYPSILLELEDIDEKLVDGVVVNISKLLQEFFTVKNVRNVKEAQLKKLVQKLSILKEKDFETILFVSSIDETILENMFKLDPEGFLLTEAPDVKTLRLIKSFEKEGPVKLVTKLK